MVAPDLEIPGTMAIPCMVPMVRAIGTVNRKMSLPSPFTRRVAHNNPPVVSSMTPTSWTDENSRSAIALDNPPMIAVGTVPMAMSMINRRSASRSNRPMAFPRPKPEARSAIAVAMDHRF